MSESQCHVFDFTLPASAVPREAIIKWLRDKCKKWCFQEEIGDDDPAKPGYRHFQGRFSLKVKVRLSTLIKTKPWPQMHLSVTSCANRKNDFYVTKEETRVDGPWKDDDEIISIPRHLEIETYLPWQQSVCNMIDTTKPGRQVHCIVDPVGNNGKSTLAGNLDCRNIAVEIPYCKDYRDVMRMVMDQPKRRVYFIDIPRALQGKALTELFAGVESVKNGYAYDDRYKFEKERFEQPHVFVFLNTYPDTSHLTNDRWKFWTINKDKELVDYTPTIEGSPPPLYVLPNGTKSLLGPVQAEVRAEVSAPPSPNTRDLYGLTYVARTNEYIDHNDPNRTTSSGWNMNWAELASNHRPPIETTGGLF